MLFGGLTPTAWDFNFRILGIPVRVAPTFWICTALLGANRQTDLYALLSWVLAAFVSVVIHEMGHALAFRHFGIDSQIILYHFGGVAVPLGRTFEWSSSRRHSAWKDLLIAAAGPAAQLAGAFIVIGLLHASRTGVGLTTLFYQLIPLPDYPPLESPTLNLLIVDFLIVSIYWAVFNLLPILPMDGGHILKELLLKFDPVNPIKHALIVSMVTAGLMAVYGLQTGSMFMTLWLGSMAMDNYQQLQQHSDRYGRPW